jgi:uridine kinase
MVRDDGDGVHTVSFPIIAISGPPGVGKSTVIASLSSKMNLHSVYFDAHETMTDRPVEEIEEWLARGMPLAEMVPVGLVDHLEAARQDRPVLFETPLGRAFPNHSRLISHSIWLDCPADIALARKISETVSRGDWDSLGDLTSWLSGYLAAYPRITAPSLLQQAARVRPLADDLIDATGDASEVAAQVGAIVDQVQQAYSV